MNFKLKTAAAAMLAVALATSPAYAGSDKDPARRPKSMQPGSQKRLRHPRSQEQIQALRKRCRARSTPEDRSGRQGWPVEEAQQAAADAQAAADRANAADAAQNCRRWWKHAAAVNTLQSTVTDLKGNQLSLATTVSDETSKIKKEIDSPTCCTTRESR
jgi:hypothetical protein